MGMKKKEELVENNTVDQCFVYMCVMSVQHRPSSGDYSVLVRERLIVIFFSKGNLALRIGFYVSHFSPLVTNFLTTSREVVCRCTVQLDWF